MPIRPQPVLKGDDGKPFEIVFNDFKGGVMTLPDESRIPPTAVYNSLNNILDEDGVWKPRPGSQAYGKGLTGPIDGIATATVYGTGTSRTTYLIAMDNGTLKYCTDGGNWTSITGKTYTVGAHTHMLQIKKRLYIANGVDNLSFVDLSTFTVTTYTALSTPTAPTLTRTTLTAGSYAVFYKITAVSDVGETAASTESTVTVNKARSNWSTTANENVVLTWPAVTGAVRYNIYFSDQTGQEVFIDSTSTLSYTDTGVANPNLYQAAPAFDGTAGPAVSRLCSSGNRIWGTGDPNNIYRISFTGVGKDLGSFNPYVGGGYIDLNLGSEERPVDIQHFRDGKGNQQAIVLTSSPTGGGSVWFITLSTLTVDVVSVVVPQAVSQGSIGSSSPYGNIQANNSVFYPSIKGFQSIGSSQAIFNVIVTNEVSANIRPNVRTITSQAANQICGIYYFGKIYWSVPYGSTVNNQIWVLDLEHQSWAQAWSIGVKQFLEYPDSSGTVHLLAIPVSGTNIIEFSPNIEGDNGLPFNVNLESGLITFDKNHFKWAWVQKVYIELGRPRGNLSFTVSGTPANKNLRGLKTLQISDQGTAIGSGVGSDMVGDFLVGDSNSTPQTFSQSSVKKVILINKQLNNIKWQLSSTDKHAGYKLLEIGITGIMLPTADPSSWRK